MFTMGQALFYRFICVFSLNSQNNVRIIPILHIRNRGTERLNDFTKVTLQARGEAGLELRRFALGPELVTSVLNCFSHLSLCPLKKEGLG